MKAIILAAYNSGGIVTVMPRIPPPPHRCPPPHSGLKSKKPCKNKEMTSVKTMKNVFNLTDTMAIIANWLLNRVFLNFFGKKIQKNSKTFLIFSIFTEKYATW